MVRNKEASDAQDTDTGDLDKRTEHVLTEYLTVTTTDEGGEGIVYIPHAYQPQSADLCMCVTHVLHMGANETGEDTRGSPQVNIRVPEQLLEEVDDVYEKRGYSNRSEFIRNAIRDALNPPIRLSDEALEDIKESKEELRKGEYVGADEL